MAIRLSICIPVFNFGAFLGETLDSILPQITADVEIVVVDGASTDNTEAVVVERAAKWPQLRYEKLAQRGGIDADLATSVELAKGEYCWLFSGDDIMRPDAIRRVLAVLAEASDVYVCEHTLCDKDMHFLRDYPIFGDGRSRFVDWSNPLQRRECLKTGLNTEVLFSFMSGLIVNRERWRSANPPLQFKGSCWWHAARLLSLAQKKLTVHYLAETYLDKRGENDSFLEHGVVNRLRIAVDGYVAIGCYFYGRDSKEVTHIKRLLRNELSPRVFCYVRELAISNPERESLPELDRLFDSCYGGFSSDCVWARILYRLIPRSIYQGLRGTYRWGRDLAKGLSGG